MPKPPEHTGKKRAKRSELADWLAETQPARIGEGEFADLMQLLAPVSVSYLRKLVRESGVSLSPLVDGVRQESFDTLEASLTALLDEYVTGDAPRRAQVRRIVITAKDHARFAVNKHPEKTEMILWMLTWLENPPLFPSWARLRRAAW